MKAIVKRELQGYFYTPVGYVYLGVFMAIASLIFLVNNVYTRSTDLSGFISMMSYVWMLLAPLLVMRLLAGERKQMTDQLLISAPLRTGQIVLGKYLAACLLLCLSILLSFAFPLLLAIRGTVFWGEVFTAYIGFLLQGCAFLAIDLLLSATTRNPASAAALTFGSNLMLWLPSLPASTSSGIIRSLLGTINLYDRLTPFLYGQLSFANIIYFLVFSTTCVMICVQLLATKHRGVSA